VSRGDSTLRGHYPLETDVIDDILVRRSVLVHGRRLPDPTPDNLLAAPKPPNTHNAARASGGKQRQMEKA